MPEAVSEPASPATTAPLQPGRGDQTGLFAVLVPACRLNSHAAGPDRGPNAASPGRPGPWSFP